MNRDIHITRGAVSLILSILTAILWFNWDTRERVIRVEAQLDAHMRVESIKHASLPDLLTTLAGADTVTNATEASRYSSRQK